MKNITREIDSKNLMKQTYEIAQHERNSGSYEELLSFQYIENTLNSYGINTNLSFHDAYISLPLDSSISIDGEKFDCITTSMSSATGEEGIVVDLIYVEDVESLDNMLFDIKGKAIIFDGFSTRNLVQKAEEKGAKACIFINGEHLHNMIVSPVWGNPTKKTIKKIPKIYVINIDQNTGEKVIEAAKRNRTAHIITKIDEGWRKIPTLIADIKGTIEPEKYILFSGHVDSWHYGAMDNATANAAMIEVARVLANKSLRRSLKIAFWSGHSHGRYAGSAYFFDDNFQEIYDDCLAHVNIDSVGAKGASIVTEGNIMALTKKLAIEVVKEETGAQFKGKPFGRSGDQSFWGAGVPSAFMGFSGQPMSAKAGKKDIEYMIKQFANGPDSSGFGWWWHTIEDTFDKIDEQNLERDTRVFLNYIYRFCTDDILPLDIEAGAEELLDIINESKHIASKYLSVNQLENGINQFMKEVYKLSNLLKNEHFKDFSMINETKHSIARVIVRLMQVNKSEFDPDPALFIPPVPLLSTVKELESPNLEAHDFFMLCTELRRRINQVSYILNKGAKEAHELMMNHSKKGVNK